MKNLFKLSALMVTLISSTTLLAQQQFNMQGNVMAPNTMGTLGQQNMMNPQQQQMMQQQQMQQQQMQMAQQQQLLGQPQGVSAQQRFAQPVVVQQAAQQPTVILGEQGDVINSGDCSKNRGDKSAMTPAYVDSQSAGHIEAGQI